MSIPTRNLVYAVRRAATYRAQGLSWDVVAQKLRRKVRTVQDWRDRYREFWEQALALARKETASDAGDEGLAIMRQLARSKDEKISKDASNRLVELRAAADTVTAISPDLLRFVEFLEGLSDDQLDSILGVDVRRVDDRPVGDPVEPPCPAIPA
jgi:transposase